MDQPRPIDDRSPLYLTLLTGVLTNEAHVYVTAGGLGSQGDPTEIALLVAALRLGLQPEEARARHPSVAEVPSEPERRYSASVRQFDGRYALFVKGAPERVLAMCSHLLTTDGARPLKHGLVQEAADAMAARGLRVLAMAYRPLDAPPADPEHLPEPSGLLFLGPPGDAGPAPSGRPGGHSRLPAGRHPGADDHRRPCPDSPGYWPVAGHLPS